MRREGCVGLTLVEVIVALTVLAINLVGWSAAVRLIIILLQRTSEFAAGLEALDLAVICSLGLLATRTPATPSIWRERHARGSVRWSISRDRRAFTLVEILVALALSALVFGLVAASFASSARFSRAALASGDALTVHLALPTMLQQVIEVAGRGVADGCALAVDASGRRLIVRHAVAVGDIAVDEVFAARDGGGRPALYLRRVPHARQPWIEDVTSFRLLDVDDDDARAASIDVAIEHHALADPLEIRIPLPHRPCLETVP